MAVAYVTMLLPTVKEVNVPDELAQKLQNLYREICYAQGSDLLDAIEKEYDEVDEQVVQHIAAEANKLRDDGYVHDIQEILAISYGGDYIEF